MQNVQNCAKCAKLYKDVPMCKIVQNVQNCAKSFKMCKVVQNVKSCAKCARLKNWEKNLGKLVSTWVTLGHFGSTWINSDSTWINLNDITSTLYKKGDKNPDTGQELLSLRKFAGQPLPGRVSWLCPSSTLASVLCWRTLWLLQTGLVMTGRGAGAHYFPQAVEQARSLRQPGQWCRLRVSIWDEESNAIPGRGGKKRCKKEVLGPLAATAESAGKDSTTGATRKKLVEAKFWLELEDTIFFGETSSDDSSLHPSPSITKYFYPSPSITL